MSVVDNIADMLEYRDGKHPYEFGSFITAVLANDLVGAFQHADANNIAMMSCYVSCLYNDMPRRTGDPTYDIWGSYDAVTNTIAKQRSAFLQAAS